MRLLSKCSLLSYGLKSLLFWAILLFLVFFVKLHIWQKAILNRNLEMNRCAHILNLLISLKERNYHTILWNFTIHSYNGLMTYCEK